MRSGRYESEPRFGRSWIFSPRELRRMHKSVQAITEIIDRASKRGLIDLDPGTPDGIMAETSAKADAAIDDINARAEAARHWLDRQSRRG